MLRQGRVQPPRFEGRRYGQDNVLTAAGQKIRPTRFLYFSIVNLLAHLAADRNTKNYELLKSIIPANVVRNQLIQKEVLRNAGMMFVPPHLIPERKQLGQIKDPRDCGDLSDLAALSSHLALLLHGFLGQPPFADEKERSAIITQVYLDATRADDDDNAFDDVGPSQALESRRSPKTSWEDRRFGKARRVSECFCFRSFSKKGIQRPQALQPEDIRLICHMVAWQFASLGDLCGDMAQMKYEKVPPQETFSDCMAQFISILSTLMGKLIGLGYFEHYRRMDIILHNIPLPMDIRDLEGRT